MSLIPLPVVQHDLPIALSTVYSGFSRGRFPWLQKRGPDGHVGRILWVDTDKYNEWAENRGQARRLPSKNGGQH